jgi:phospholipase C
MLYDSSLGLGFRVPAIIISPYAKAGYIDHTQYQFESMLKFIEWRFNIPPLTARDAHAKNLLNAFDFNQKPRLPHIIPLS